jgi:hypothetical protein
MWSVGTFGRGYGERKGLKGEGGLEKKEEKEEKDI